MSDNGVAANHAMPDGDSPAMTVVLEGNPSTDAGDAKGGSSVDVVIKSSKVH